MIDGAVDPAVRSAKAGRSADARVVVPVFGRLLRLLRLLVAPVAVHPAAPTGHGSPWEEVPSRQRTHGFPPATTAKRLSPAERPHRRVTSAPGRRRGPRVTLDAVETGKPAEGTVTASKRRATGQPLPRSAATRRDAGNERACRPPHAGDRSLSGGLGRHIAREPARTVSTWRSPAATGPPSTTWPVISAASDPWCGRIQPTSPTPAQRRAW